MKKLFITMLSVLCLTLTACSVLNDVTIESKGATAQYDSYHILAADDNGILFWYDKTNYTDEMVMKDAQYFCDTVGQGGEAVLIHVGDDPQNDYMRYAEIECLQTSGEPKDVLYYRISF